MANTMWKRAEAWLLIHPAATARELEEFLGCARSSAYQYRQKFLKKHGDGGSNNVMQFPTGAGPTLSRPRVEDLSGMAQRDVAERLSNVHGRLDELLAVSMEGMSPADQQRCNAALQSAAKAAQLIADSYPGAAKLVAEIDADSQDASIADDLATADQWLGQA